MGIFQQKFTLLLVMVMFQFTPSPAYAYIGPGAGIAAFGTIVALLGGILLAIVSFLWYPIKRLRAKFKKKRTCDQQGTSS